jgi:membrane-associated phospholipid phosphatase/diacylglycerol kinase family enzyme
MMTGRPARWRRELAAVDLALFERVADRPSPSLDRRLLRLTRAANHAKLWIGLAAALGVLGGRRGRSAAIRGLAALAIAAPIANLPVKLGARRHRPPLDRVPVARRLRRHPRTFSFPSGHSASGAAFATGVAIERPMFGVPTGLLAAAVGFSRVHVGVHYPSDVIAGAAIGVAAGLLTLRPWPRQGRDPDRTPARRCAGTSAADLVIVANTEAGSAGDLEVLREHFPGADLVVLDDEDRFEDAIRGAAQRANVLGVAGGDGTVSAAAEAAAAEGRPLLVIPSGTRNHLASDLGLETVDDAVGALEAGETISMDLGVAGDVVFVNTLALGDYPRIVDLRERLSPEIGDSPAAVVAVTRALRGAEALELELDGTARRVWLLFVGNCRYEPHGFTGGWRRSLDDGILDVRLIDAERRLARTRLVLALLAGTIDRTPVHERHLVEGIRIGALRGYSRLAYDGETAEAPDVLDVSKRRGALTVFVGPERTSRP